MTSEIQAPQMHAFTYLTPNAVTINPQSSKDIANLNDVLPSGAQFVSARNGYSTVSGIGQIVFGATQWYSNAYLVGWNTGTTAITIPAGSAITVVYFKP